LSELESIRAYLRSLTPQGRIIFADRAELSERHLRKIMQGLYAPRYATMQRIQAAMGRRRK
jgi:predicted transcriptional regulator